MYKWRILYVVMILLLLTSCSNRQVRQFAVVADYENSGSNADESSALSENGVESSEIGIEKDKLSPEKDTATENKPDENEIIGVAEAENVASSGPETPIKNTEIIIIKSENSYTDSEKERLLSEIDALLEETLKDIDDAAIFEILNELEEVN